ncbi:hypothetical protein P4S68_13900 [Pseudoalteromonas sp. Hal099]
MMALILELDAYLGKYVQLTDKVSADYGIAYYYTKVITAMVTTPKPTQNLAIASE